MAKPNGRGGWDLTDGDVAEIMAVNWPDDPREDLRQAVTAAGFGPGPEQVTVQFQPDVGCRVYWGHSGCALERGHAGNHRNEHGIEVNVRSAFLFGEDLTPAEIVERDETW